MAAGGTALFRQLHRHPFPFVAGTLQQRNHRRPNQENGLPFDTFKVSRFKEATAKRSLTKEDIRRIMDCEVRTLTKYPKPFLQLAKDLFLFSYLSCGINLTDILHIRYADIVDGRLVSTDRKRVNSCRSNSNPPPSTSSTSTANRTHIRRTMFPCFKAFCSHYGTTAVRTGATDEQADKSLSETNRRASAPAYHAHDIRCAALVRNCSERSGVSTSIISESLGHSSEKITQIYLDSFENSQIDAAMQTYCEVVTRFEKGLSYSPQN